MNATSDRPGAPDAVDHEVVITRREKVVIRGVLNVESFDDKEVLLETGMGVMVLRGEKLHIRQLDLDTGAFAVEGVVSGLQYVAASGRERDRGKGFLDRLLR